jgi:hypothetical protein
MSASGTVELLRTPSGVKRVAYDYLGVSLDDSTAALVGLPPITTPFGWASNRDGVSAGPVIWLKLRLMELGKVGKALAEDDSLPIAFVGRRGRNGRQLATICSVARSRMFNTPLMVYPIDLKSGRVSGMRKRLKTNEVAK